ncbi:hypothetical protein VTK26DRAFT_2200 [Humicola hyalothermophila]
MKLPTALFSLALAGAAVAQGIPGLPSCAEGCADQFLQNGIGNCGTNPKCICENKDFLGSIACCLVGVCDEEAQTSAVAFASSFCRAMQVTDLPTAVSCTTGNAAQTTPATAQTTGGTGAGTAPTPTPTGNADADSQETDASPTSNLGPRPTAAAGLGAIGGLVAAVALL